MLAGIIALFQVLPEVVAILSKMGTLVDRLVKYAQQNNLNAWMDNLEKSIDKLEQAETPADKIGAAQDLVNIVRNLGPK